MDLVGTPSRKKKGSEEIEAHKQFSWSFSLWPIWSMACSWYWTLSVITTCQQKREHSIDISCSALATHTYQNCERNRLTKHVRITAFVEQQWNKTNVKVIPAFSGSRTAPQSWHTAIWCGIKLIPIQGGKKYLRLKIKRKQSCFWN